MIDENFCNVEHCNERYSKKEAYCIKGEIQPIFCSFYRNYKKKQLGIIDVNFNKLLSNYLNQFNFYLDSSLDYKNDLESLEQIKAFLVKKLNITFFFTKSNFFGNFFSESKTQISESKTQIKFKDKIITGYGSNEPESLFYSIINFINSNREFNTRFVAFYLDTDKNSIKKISFLNKKDLILTTKWKKENMYLLAFYDLLLDDFIYILDGETVENLGNFIKKVGFENG